MAEQNQPRKYDAVLGGQSPPPIDSAVLGGIEGIKRRLSNPVVDVKLAALTDALKYGDAGLELVIQALRWEPKKIQRHAYKLLRRREEVEVKQALEEYQPWDLLERFKELYAETFANRQIVDYNPEVGITNPANTAYALRWDYDSAPLETELLTSFLEDSQASKLEALIIGEWGEAYENDSSEIINVLVNAKDKLTNLKAIFIGDIESSECEISWIRQSDISPILRAYPQLKVLQVRGGDGLKFNAPVRHNNLQTLIVETGALDIEIAVQICNMNLPALEHLELWFGSGSYGGDCTVEDIKPIIEDLIFPDLNYLGLRNGEFSDEIAEALIKSPLIETISVLDLSMGNLSDKGAEYLLNCAAVNELDILNVADNYLSEEMIGKLSALDCKLLAGGQDKDYDDYRYCSVSE